MFAKAIRKNNGQIKVTIAPEKKGPTFNPVSDDQLQAYRKVAEKAIKADTKYTYMIADLDKGEPVYFTQKHKYVEDVITALTSKKKAASKPAAKRKKASKPKAKTPELVMADMVGTYGQEKVTDILEDLGIFL